MRIKNIHNVPMHTRFGRLNPGDEMVISKEELKNISKEAQFSQSQKIEDYCRLVIKPCQFCYFNKQAEVFYLDRWKNIIICRDKKDLGFKYRLLGVRMGMEHHKKIPTFEEREELLIPLIAVVEAHIRNGRASGYDIDEIVKENHYHYYANIT